MMAIASLDYPIPGSASDYCRLHSGAWQGAATSRFRHQSAISCGGFRRRRSAEKREICVVGHVGYADA
jgi:hypothetical protein